MANSFLCGDLKVQVKDNLLKIMVLTLILRVMSMWLIRETIVYKNPPAIYNALYRIKLFFYNIEVTYFFCSICSVKNIIFKHSPECRKCFKEPNHEGQQQSLKMQHDSLYYTD